jgi:hypothetical protein
VNEEHVLQRTPGPPEHRNSAGRLLGLLHMLDSQESYYATIAAFYGEKPAGNVRHPDAGHLYISFMQILSSAHYKFMDDLSTTEAIPPASKDVIVDGLSKLGEIVHPNNPNDAPRPLQEAEAALLKMAGSMLPEEAELGDDDREKLQSSTEELKQAISDSELPKSVRRALLEVVRLSRNAIDHYTIWGGRGFRTAFKRMLSELMEVYLQEGTSEPKDKPWWRQALEHVALFDALAARLLRHKPLLASADIHRLLSG